MRALLLAVLLFGVSAASPPPPVRVTPNPEDDEDPTVVLARDGRFYVVWSWKQNGRVDLFLRSSRDGRTWGDERRITDDAVEDYYPSLTQSEDGMFHLAWFRLQRAAGRVNIWYTRSADGQHWTSPIPITNSGRDWAPVLYEAARGVLWIVWSSWRTGNRELFAVRSADGGRHWSQPRRLTQTPEEDDFPHVLATSGGERALVWTRYAKGSNLLDYFKDATAEIVMATSRDGLHWSAPTVVSPPDPAARYMDFLPFVFADRDGNHLYLSWTSNRSRIDRGEILVRDLVSPSSPVRQLVAPEFGGFDAKVAPTRRNGEYLLVWVASTGATKDIFARRFRLPPPP